MNDVKKYPQGSFSSQLNRLCTILCSCRQEGVQISWNFLIVVIIYKRTNNNKVLDDRGRGHTTTTTVINYAL